MCLQKVVTVAHGAASNTLEGPMRRYWLVLTAVLLLAGAPAAFPQNKKAEAASRSVKGTVRMADEQVATGAVVQLKNSKTLQVRSFITKEDGTYYFHGLSPDVDY